MFPAFRKPQFWFFGNMALSSSASGEESIKQISGIARNAIEEIDKFHMIWQRNTEILYNQEVGSSFRFGYHLCLHRQLDELDAPLLTVCQRLLQVDEWFAPPPLQTMQFH